MKSRLLICFTASLMLFISVSCEENISPKTDFEEEYALFCVINVDTTYQTAYLSRSYEIDGYNPNNNHIDPAIETAEIKLKNLRDQKEYGFKGDSVSRTDLSRYNGPMKFYSMNNFRANFGDSIEITATLASGKVLKSRTKIPALNHIVFDQSLFLYDPTPYLEQAKPGLEFKWWFINENISEVANYYYLPSLNLYYTTTDNPGVIRCVKVAYQININSLGETVITYSGIINKKEVYYGAETVKRAMSEISEGDPNKGKYKVLYFELTLLTVDKYLASYFSAQDVFSGEFSMRIDVPNFTNISNGMGLYGVYGAMKKRVFISQAYADEFGYQTGFNE